MGVHKMERLSKVIANSGYTSRRNAEKLIQEGRVKVNGNKITELGYKVSPFDEIHVDEIKIEKEELSYILINKPTGYLSTIDDHLKRRTVKDLLGLEESRLHLFATHKLEYDMAGVLIMTNDGNLTKSLQFANDKIEKEYLIRLKGIMIKEKLRKLRSGIQVENQKVKPIDAQILELDKKNQSTLLRIVVTKETHKDIRKALLILGHEIKNFTRIRYDFITLDGVERGNYRMLKIHEVKRLYRDRMISQ
jgi:23S rRNA pseudouridine2605 synthase